jgi:hypothetical protein
MAGIEDSLFTPVSTNSELVPEELVPDSDSEESSSSDSSEGLRTPNPLDRLKSPKLSDLARKRKIQTNPPKGKRKGTGAVASEPFYFSIYPA